MNTRVFKTTVILFFSASVLCTAQLVNNNNGFNGNGIANNGNYGGNTVNQTMLIPRVMTVPGYYGTGIRGVTVRTPTAYSQTVARSFFISGGIRLGMPATVTGVYGQQGYQVNQNAIVPVR